MKSFIKIKSFTCIIISFVVQVGQYGTENQNFVSSSFKSGLIH